MSREIVQQTLANALSMDRSVLQKFEDELRPMFVALPKDTTGALEPPVVPYALHRYFVQKHGWHIKGLELHGHAPNISSPTGILKDHVPEFVQNLLEEHVQGQGWGLHELAVCSAALEELIQREFVGDLEYVYRMLELSTSSALGDTELDELVETYLAQYLVEETFQDMRPDALIQEMKDSYAFWNDLTMWSKDVRKSLDRLHHSNPFVHRTGYSFERVSRIVQEIMGQYTSFQSLECSTMTNVILDLEHKNSGRVPLAKFYSAGLVQAWKFWEPKEYLQHAGALDETDPKSPSVIIPNYIYGMNNCLASSSFFSVCCANECDRLTGHLESALAAASATPERIAKLVSQLPSQTVDAPRELPTMLLSRLHEISELHGGEVPLHGRLFSQWMHHTYPRECPFPHIDGEKNPLTPEAWAEAYGKDYTASDDEMRRHIREHKETSHIQNELPWTAIEELVGTHHHGQIPSWRQKVLAFAAVVGIAVPLLQAWHTFLGVHSTRSSKCKHLV